MIQHVNKLIKLQSPVIQQKREIISGMSVEYGLGLQEQLLQVLSQDLSPYQHELEQLTFLQYRKKYRKYSIELKKTAVELYKTCRNYHTVSRQLNVPIKNVHRWVNSKACPGQRGKKPFDFQMELQLANIVRTQHETSQGINAVEIRKMARSLCRKQNFAATVGWFYNFIRRHKLKDQVKASH